jgi:hypothetical protein
MKKYWSYEDSIILQAAEIIKERQKAEKRERLTLKRRIVKRVQLSGLMEKVEKGVVTFTKLNRQTRVMHFEPRDVWNKRDLETQFLTVFDLEKGDFRKVNLETVTEVRTDDTVYQVIG